MAGKKQEKPDKHLGHVPMKKLAHELQVGDRIVVTVNQEGFVTKSILVNKIATGESCLNFHVNGNACYDRSMPIVVSVPADQANKAAIAEVIALMEAV